MSKNIFYFAIILFISLTGCDNQNTNAKAPLFANKTAVDSIIIINDRGITLQEFNLFKKDVQLKHPDKDFTDEELLQQLIDLDLWAQEARRRLLNTDKNNILHIKLMTKAFYAEQAKIQAELNSPVETDQLRAEYAKRYGNMTVQQVKLLIFESPSQARVEKMIGHVQMGAKLKELVKTEQRADESYKELSWVYTADLSPELIKVVEAIQESRFNLTPVKIDNVWQLVYLEDSRTVPSPTLDEVKAKLVADLKRQKVLDRTQVLYNEADIIKQ